MNKIDISIQLLEWYSENRRDLPWRRSADPYAIWVSEVMLQQTRVETVIPYYERWMDRFPNLVDLAAASQQEVLVLWEGLGYYQRARNLHRAARVVVEEYQGELPRDVEKLRQLPGIGRYTAGAIASIAFNLDTPVLDGNIRRIYSRLFDVRHTKGSKGAERELWRLAASCLPGGVAGDYNQALMDLGSMICMPQNPACDRCPLEDHCQARKLGVQSERPVRPPAREIPHHTVTAAIIRSETGYVLIAQRPQEGLLGGLWEFPGGKTLPGEGLVDCLQREIGEELGVRVQVDRSLGIFRHAYTHFRVTLHAFYCSLTDGKPNPIQASALVWVPVGELQHYPMGKIDRQIARRLERTKAKPSRRA